jgi:hypothetical protein
MSGSLEINSSSFIQSFETISPHPAAMGSLIVEFFPPQGNGSTPTDPSFACAVEYEPRPSEKNELDGIGDFLYRARIKKKESKG